MDLSPAQAKMAARAAALAAEQAQRRAQPVVDTRQLGGSGLTQTPLAQRQVIINQAQGGPASRMGQGLEMMPLAQRQAQINAAQGGPAQYYGQALTNPFQPQGPVRPQMASQSQTGGPGQMPPAQLNPGLRTPAPRLGVPGAAPQYQAPPPMPRPQQQRPQQPRGPVAPQNRPEPSFFQQALQYAKPVSQGIGALSSLFSLF